MTAPYTYCSGITVVIVIIIIIILIGLQIEQSSLTINDELDRARIEADTVERSARVNTSVT